MSKVVQLRAAIAPRGFVLPKHLNLMSSDAGNLPGLGAVFRSCPPGPNTWTLNIQPLGQFRPHRGFLLARCTLPCSVARLLHTAG